MIALSECLKAIQKRNQHSTNFSIAKLLTSNLYEEYVSYKVKELDGRTRMATQLENAQRCDHKTFVLSGINLYQKVAQARKSWQDVGYRCLEIVAIFNG